MIKVKLVRHPADGFPVPIGATGLGWPTGEHMQVRFGEHGQRMVPFDCLEVMPPEELHPDLAPWVCEIGESGMRGLKHRLVFVVPYVGDMENARINAMYQQKLDMLDEYMRERQWDRYIFMHERPYRIDALKELVMLDMIKDDAEYWDLVRYVWTDTENAWQEFATWRWLWASERPGRAEHVMTDDERATLAAMGDEFTIYRGYGSGGRKRGLSWTTDRAKAEWFANRLAEKGEARHVVTGTVKKADVYAYLAGRGESEIVVDPDRVKIERK